MTVNSKPDMQIIKFKSSGEAIDKFRGKQLVVKSYQADPELNYYVGDLISVPDIVSVIGEVESGESELTLEGKEFFLYGAKESNLTEILETKVFREDYIKDFEDLVSFAHLVPNEIESERAFNADKTFQELSEVAKELGIDIPELQPLKLQKRDAAFQKLKTLFELIFNNDFGTVLRNFRARFLFEDTSQVLYVDMFKKNYALTFNPSIYIQGTTDDKGEILRNDRESIRLTFPSLQNAVIDPEDPNFFQKGTKLFQTVKSAAFDYFSCGGNTNDFISKSSIPVQSFILPKGKLWNDILNQKNVSANIEPEKP